MRTVIDFPAQKLCLLPGCHREHHSHGHCSMHWRRLQRHGSTEIIQRHANGSALRWIREVALPFTGQECLEHTFSVGSHGYGQLVVDGVKHLIHRYVCELAHGACPQDKDQAAHYCGNRKCANPLHLRWATFSENQHDKLSHGKDNRGERNHAARLTEAKAREILSSSESQSALASRYGVSAGTIGSIKRRENWSWL